MSAVLALLASVEAGDFVVTRGQCALLGIAVMALAIFVGLLWPVPGDDEREGDR